MQFQSEHIAASSSPMYGGGLRWGTNDFTLNKTEVGDKRPRLRAVPHPGLPPQSGGRRRCHMQVMSCYMQFQSEHIAASSSPMYGGGLRWGTNDFTLNKTEAGGKRPRT